MEASAMLGRRRLAVIVAAAGYAGCVRPWMLHWGSREAERREPLPGDEVIADATLSVTRAVDIAVPPSDVWPWPVELGFGPHRAGFYGYDWLENLVGLDIHSAPQVLPELQDLKVGDQDTRFEG